MFVVNRTKGLKYHLFYLCVCVCVCVCVFVCVFIAVLQWICFHIIFVGSSHLMNKVEVVLSFTFTVL